MNLPKAIEILSNHGLKPEGATWGDYLEAEKLGAEALKEVIEARLMDSPLPHTQLPSETKD